MNRNELFTKGAVISAVLAAWLAASPSTAVAAQKLFPTPEAAVDALLEAFKNHDEGALLDIFGHEFDEVVVRTDKVAEREAHEELYSAAQVQRKLEHQGADQRILILGSKHWPFPIPLVKQQQGWRFDTAAGAEEILNRRIGENELETIAACRAYVSAQVQYAARDRDGDQVREYAQRFGSTAGQRDGLYWKSDPTSGEEPSPFGPLLADASAYMKAARKARQAKERLPFYGYYYRILTGQGPNPPGGAHEYVINGNMIAGFALLAWPADYEASGIMTFVVSHQGQVYEKDLGEKTSEIVKTITTYNPDVSWGVAEDK